MVEDLFVYDADRYDEEISLSQFRPLSELGIGQKLKGHVRSMRPFAAFVDVGCESDAFLHKTSLEDAFRNRIIFDVTKVSIHRDSLFLSL